MGDIGTGFLAIPVLSGSLSYLIAETFGWKGDLDKKYYKAKPFYITIIVSLILGLLIYDRNRKGEGNILMASFTEGDICMGKIMDSNPLASDWLAG